MALGGQMQRAEVKIEMPRVGLPDIAFSHSSLFCDWEAVARPSARRRPSILGRASRHAPRHEYTSVLDERSRQMPLRSERGEGCDGEEADMMTLGGDDAMSKGKSRCAGG